MRAVHSAQGIEISTKSGVVVARYDRQNKTFTPAVDNALEVLLRSILGPGQLELKTSDHVVVAQYDAIKDKFLCREGALDMILRDAFSEHLGEFKMPTLPQ